MKCLVTGGSGFLGTNLIHELVKIGWNVKAIVRPNSNIEYIKSLPIEIIYGDIANRKDIENAVVGCEIVFHVAGDTSFWKKNFKKQHVINTEVPSIIAEACIKNKVKRLIHTSTVDALGYNPTGLATERWGYYNFANMDYNYADTKREGEKKLIKYNSKDLEIIIIYPGSMIGPYDFTFQYGRLFFDIQSGKIFGAPAGGASFCHVTQVALAHINAATRGIPGEGYICAGTNITYSKLFEQISSKLKKENPKFIFPKWLLVTYGYIEQALSCFSGRAPEIDPGNARYMSIKAWYDSSKAIKNIDYQIVPVENMINDAYNWYVENNFIKA